jgi:hypothetical protein
MSRTTVLCLCIGNNGLTLTVVITFNIHITSTGKRSAHFTSKYIPKHRTNLTNMNCLLSTHSLIIKCSVFQLAETIVLNSMLITKHQFTVSQMLIT